MVCRVLATCLLGLSLGLSTAEAQGYPPASSPYGSPYGPGAGFAPPGGDHSGSASFSSPGAFAGPSMGGPAQYDSRGEIIPTQMTTAPVFVDGSSPGVQPAFQGPAPNTHSPYITPSVDFHTPAHLNDVRPNTPYYGPDGIIREEQDLAWWDDQGWLEQAFVNAFDNTWVRAEFVHWRTTAPGRVQNGAPVAGVPDPTVPFTAIDPGPPIVNFNVVVPTQEDLDPEYTPGLRLTYGVPLTIGYWEVSGFALEQNSENVNDPRLTDPLNPQFLDPLGLGLGRIVISTLDSGVVGTTLQSFDVSYAQQYATDVWGFDTALTIDRNWFFWDVLEIKPFFGPRMVFANEQHVQFGIFDNNGAQAPVLTTIAATTSNRLIGFGGGIKAEIEHPWFKLGVAPRISVAANFAEVNVATDNFRGAADPITFSQIDSEIFTGVFEAVAYLRIPIRDGFWITGSYDIMYLPRIQRANNAVFYNDLGALQPPAIAAQSSVSELIIEGFSLGFEWNF